MDKDEKECRELLSLNIKRYRARLGMSQMDFSLAMDISTPFLSDIELGKKWVSPKTLAKLARALHVDISDLFKREDEPPKPTVAAEVIKYLDSVDDTLIKQIINSIEPAIERSVNHSISNMRKYYVEQLTEKGESG
ncbi:MAG: helix-turn-helix transcriptional regulator [Prevotella sp.]|jgi:transcriptional regulator with XRE-family HTH domain|nr:helix-turn-helix transcriptional regulator [Prevotella sp.]